MNKRTQEEYEDAIKSSHSIAEALRKLNIINRGGNYRIIKNAAKKYNIDISHFEGQSWSKGKNLGPKPKIKIEDILVEHSTYETSKLKRRLFLEGYKEKKCECCGNTEWMGKPMPLELHHINGDNSDNRIENIEILCPNCHALTENYRGKNKKA